jgi:Tfp pilus assembly protein PilF
LWDLGRPQQALKDVDQAIKLNDQIPSAYAIRALANTYLGDDDTAKADAEKAIQLGFDGDLLRHFIRQAERQRKST